MTTEETRRAAEREADAELDAILKEIDAAPRKKSAPKEKTARPADPQRRKTASQRPASGSSTGRREGAPRKATSRTLETEKVGSAKRSSTGSSRPAQRTAQPQRRRPAAEGTERLVRRAPAKQQNAARTRNADEQTVRRTAAAAAKGGTRKKSAAAVKKSNPNRFRIGMLIYVIIFLIFTMFLMHRLWGFLGEYEASRPQYTIDGYVTSLNNGFYHDMVRQKVEDMQVSEYENAEVISETLNMEELDGATFTWARKGDEYTDERPVYYIRYGSNAIASVALERISDTEKFKQPVWQVTEPTSLIELATEPAYSVDITVPEGTSVSVNGIAVPQTAMVACDSPVVLDEASKAYAKQPAAVKAEISGLYVAPKIQAYDSQGNILEALTVPKANETHQVYVYEPKDDVAPDPQFITHMENLMGAYINYTANKDEQVWTNLGVLDQYLVGNGTAYNMLHSMTMDFNWNNPYNAREDRELTISHVKMYADNVCTAEAHFDYSLTKYNPQLGQNITNDYVGTIRWTMVKVGNIWLASNFEQLADESGKGSSTSAGMANTGTEAPAETAAPAEETSPAETETIPEAVMIPAETKAPAETEAAAETAAPIV